jgi:hypothetical protein
MLSCIPPPGAPEFCAITALRGLVDLRPVDRAYRVGQVRAPRLRGAPGDDQLLHPQIVDGQRHIHDLLVGRHIDDRRAVADPLDDEPDRALLNGQREAAILTPYGSDGGPVDGDLGERNLLVRHVVSHLARDGSLLGQSGCGEEE